jgi:5-methylthioadenosine/S-adenosylhomocysteine deaminase
MPMSNNLQMIDTLIHAKWVIPVEPAGLVLSNHSVAIHQQKIVAILPTEQARQQYQAKQEISRKQHALIPGLVNTHTHVAMNLLRGFADDLGLMTWLQEYVWPAEKAHVSPEFVRAGSELAIAEMIKGGVTCFNDMYFFPEQTAEVAAHAGIRAFVGAALMGFPTAWATDDEDAIAKGLALRDKYQHNDLINVTLAPHAIYTVPEASLRRVAEVSREYHLGINIHVQETADEVNNSIAQTGKRPLARLQEYGVNCDRMISVHMTQMTDEDIHILAESGASVVHCPESNMKLASGYCPVTRLVDAGINVALGTDGAASNNDLSMLGEMRSAALLSKLMTGNPEALPATLALQMATLNGAKALGMEQHIGSLTVGKSADIVAIDLEQLNTVPVYHPISQIVYAASRDQVTDVWVAGKALLTNKNLTTLDEPALLALAAHWQGKISA